jgi:N-terminal domain of anti-restriction factor ArdC
MANAVKTCWRDMDEEAADELIGCEPHDLLPRVAIDAVILVLERDAGAVAGKQAAVGEGDAVGIARQIGQHGLGAAEGAFAVDHPFDPALRQPLGRERPLYRPRRRASPDQPAAAALARTSPRPEHDRMPWHHDGSSISRPKNVASGEGYRGINVLALWAYASGYSSGIRGTYKQWREAGAQVRSGRHY